MKNALFNKGLLVVLLVFGCFVTTYAQQSKQDKNEQEKARIQNLINSKNYVFVAQQALPLGGRTINLTTTYSLRLTGDTLVSDLPYFGRAFVAPMDPSQGGIQFTSTNFSYNLQNRKKGGWDITILPKDTKDVRQMFLTVTESGYGSLQVTSNSKEAISYNGYIRERRRQKI